MSDRDSKRLSSGHSAGFQSSSRFRENEKIVRDKHSNQDVEDPTLTGQNAETVYRDKRGRKLDMLNEFMRQTAVQESKQYKLEKAQFAWGQGSVQKQEVDEKQRELEEIKYEPFARTINDSKLEELRKQEIRDGDPMAEYFMSKKPKREASEDRDERIKPSRDSSQPTKKSKPIYKGPQPPPNRFKIRPGYRWDAVDRGNRFEHKLLVKMSEKASGREDEYKYLSSDM